MNETIHQLIKNNRKLFYTGQIRNKYKTEVEKTIDPKNEVYIYTINKKNIKRKSLTTRSIEIFQEIFID